MFSSGMDDYEPSYPHGKIIVCRDYWDKLLELEKQANEAGGIAKLQSKLSEAEEKIEELEKLKDEVCDLFHIGKLGRESSVILTNIQNASRRSDCLSEIELFFTIEDEEWSECPLNWSDNPEDYIKKFIKALTTKLKEA